MAVPDYLVPEEGKRITAVQMLMERVWLMHISGEYTQAEIATETGISFGRVSQIIKKVGTVMHEEFAKENAHLIATQSQRYEKLLAEVLKAWNKSKEPRKRVNTRKVSKPPQERLAEGESETEEQGRRLEEILNEVSTQAEEREGSPVYMQLALQIMQAQQRLHSMEPPIKVARTDASGKDTAEEMNQKFELSKRELVDKLESQVQALLEGRLLVAEDGSIVEAVEGEVFESKNLAIQQSNDSPEQQALDAIAGHLENFVDAMDEAVEDDFESQI